MKSLLKTKADAEFEGFLYLINHGCLIVDETGSLRYLQIYGTPQSGQLMNAFQKHIYPVLQKSASKPTGATPKSGK